MIAASAHKHRAALFFAATVLTLYAALVAVTAAHHEQWYDEVHPWLVARDSSFFTIIWTDLRYEGTPALWYLVLYIPAHVLGAPVWTMQVIAATATTVGVAIFLLFSPFPWSIKLLAPFSYFLAYQYAVVARNYALFVPLIFGVAALYPTRKQRPIAYAVLLALMANLSGHTLMVAFGLAALEAIDLSRDTSAGGEASLTRRSMALGIIAAAGLIAFAVLYPPQDQVDAPALRPLVLAMKRALGFFSRSLTDWPPLSVVLLGVTLFWLWLTRTFTLYFVPTLMVSLLIGFLYASPWHEGILILVWLAALWQSFDPARLADVRLPRVRRLARQATVSSIVLVLGVHVYWAARATLNDWRFPYSGAPAAAKYIKEHGLDMGRIIALSEEPLYRFQPFAILPYFNHNIFSNYDPSMSYWRFFRPLSPGQKSTSVTIEPNVQSVVLGLSGYGRQKPIVPPAGFHVAAIFPGDLFWKDRIHEDDSFVIFERDQKH